MGNFVWHGKTDRFRHIVGWNDIINPTNLSGFGIYPTRLQNIILLGKLAWNLDQSNKKL